MSPKKKNLISIRGKKPATEASCAKDGKYVYLAESTMTPEIRATIQNKVKEKLEEKPLQKCKCRPRNGTCCNSKSCLFRKMRRACTEQCAAGCMNNPWRNGGEGFAINQGKLFTHKLPIVEWGLFALKPIKKDEFLGEFKGNLTSELPTGEALNYAMRLKKGLNIYINPHAEGSSMRLCNHSCDPNVEVVPYIHDGLFKIVFIAVRGIKVGEQLTFDYGWTFHRRTEQRVVCGCGSDCCTGYLGPWSDVVDDRLVLPVVFPNIATRASAIVEDKLNETPELNELDLDREEDHIFGPEEPVAVIVLSDGQLRICKGRVLECYVSKHNLYFYVVRVVGQSVYDLHAPMWFVFRYIEVAEVMLAKVFTDEEKIIIKNYYGQTQSRRSERNVKKRADVYEGEILFSYVKRFLAGEIPKFVKKTRAAVGSSSVGFNQFYLDVVQEPVVDVIPSSDPPPHSAMRPSSEYPPTIQDIRTLEERVYALRRSNASAASPSNTAGASSTGASPGTVSPIPGSPCTSNGQEKSTTIDAANGMKAYNFNLVDDFLDELGLFDPSEDDDNDFIEGAMFEGEVFEGYEGSNTERNLRDVVEKHKNAAFFKRFFQHAVEQLTLITIWRSPLSVTLDFESVYEKTEKDLKTMYYAHHPKNRRFFFPEHYKLYCEILNPGSFAMRYCSICGMAHNFPLLDDWNAHFHQYHEIGASMYKCKCNRFENRLISMFRTHVETCCPEYLCLLRMDLEPYFLDSYCDYLSLKSVKGHIKHILAPGQALVVDPKREGDLPRGAKKVIPRIKFNPATLSPVEERFVLFPYNFEVQATSTTIDLGEKLVWETNKTTTFDLSKVNSMRAILPIDHAAGSEMDSGNSLVPELPIIDQRVCDRKTRNRQNPNDQQAGPSTGAVIPEAENVVAKPVEKPRAKTKTPSTTTSQPTAGSSKGGSSRAKVIKRKAEQGANDQIVPEENPSGDISDDRGIAAREKAVGKSRKKGASSAGAKKTPTMAATAKVCDENIPPSADSSPEPKTKTKGPSSKRQKK